MARRRRRLDYNRRMLALLRLSAAERSAGAVPFGEVAGRVVQQLGEDLDKGPRG